MVMRKLDRSKRSVLRDGDDKSKPDSASDPRLPSIEAFLGISGLISMIADATSAMIRGRSYLHIQMYWWKSKTPFLLEIGLRNEYHLLRVDF